MIKVGDVFGIDTKKGEAYIQYLGKDERGASAVRVLYGFFDIDHSKLAEAVQKYTNFITFYPANVALRRKMIKKIGYFEVPEHSKKLPKFRSMTQIKNPHKIDGWLIPDNNGICNSVLFSEMTLEQKKIPSSSLINHDLLIARIEEDWLPEKALW